jgi:hypothetical protein
VRRVGDAAWHFQHGPQGQVMPDANGPGSRLQREAVARIDDQGVSGCGQAVGEGAAETARCAGDDRH